MFHNVKKVVLPTEAHRRVPRKYYWDDGICVHVVVSLFSLVRCLSPNIECG